MPYPFSLLFVDDFNIYTTAGCACGSLHHCAYSFGDSAVFAYHLAHIAGCNTEVECYLVT